VAGLNLAPWRKTGRIELPSRQVDAVQRKASKPRENPQFLSTLPLRELGVLAVPFFGFQGMIPPPMEYIVSLAHFRSIGRPAKTSGSLSLRLGSRGVIPDQLKIVGLSELINTVQRLATPSWVFNVASVEITSWTRSSESACWATRARIPL
jgi:hypothetical protein